MTNGKGNTMPKEEIERRYNAYIQTGSYEKAGKLLNMAASSITRAVRMKTGKCACGKNVNLPHSKTMCETCQAKNQARLKEKRKKLNENKMCIHCHKNQVEYGHKSYCKECSEKRANTYAGLKEIKDKRNECLACSNPRVEGKTRCEYHIEYMNQQNKRYKLEHGFGGNRKFVLERDKYTCQCCGYKGVIEKVKGQKWLEIHHLYTRSNKPDNLITLCNKCHRGITHLYKSENVKSIIGFVKKYYPDNYK